MKYQLHYCSGDSECYFILNNGLNIKIINVNMIYTIIYNAEDNTIDILSYRCSVYPHQFFTSRLAPFNINASLLLNCYWKLINAKLIINIFYFNLYNFCMVYACLWLLFGYVINVVPMLCPQSSNLQELCLCMGYGTCDFFLIFSLVQL